MSIIDETYFQDTELALPIDNISDIQEYIDKHEKEVLKNRLGYQLYLEFITALAGTPAAKWVSLRDGGVYVDDNGVQQEYEGIKQIIANYVFFMIVANKQNYTTGSGVKRGLTDNSEIADPKYKQAYAWNDMIDRAVYLDGFIEKANETDPTTYENYEPTPFSSRGSSKVNVLNI